MASTMVDWRGEEAENQTVVRQMNEWTEEAADAQLGLERPMDAYLCECSDRGCAATISLTRGEYETVRASSVSFAIALNHENPEVERLVSENERFATVSKFYGLPARIARAADPRR